MLTAHPLLDGATKVCFAMIVYSHRLQEPGDEAVPRPDGVPDLGLLHAGHLDPDTPVHLHIPAAFYEDDMSYIV